MRVLHHGALTWGVGPFIGWGWGALVACRVGRRVEEPESEGVHWSRLHLKLAFTKLLAGVRQASRQPLSDRF